MNSKTEKKGGGGFVVTLASRGAVGCLNFLIGRVSVQPRGWKRELEIAPLALWFSIPCATGGSRRG
jgi:hypothetical protein